MFNPHRHHRHHHHHHRRHHHNNGVGLGVGLVEGAMIGAAAGLTYNAMTQPTRTSVVVQPQTVTYTPPVAPIGRVTEIYHYDVNGLAVEVFENQRWYPVSKWSNSLLASDRNHWSNMYGLTKKAPILDPSRGMDDTPPAGCHWTGPWACLEWQYATDFGLNMHAGQRSGDFVRRRKWHRGFAPNVTPQPSVPQPQYATQNSSNPQYSQPQPQYPHQQPHQQQQPQPQYSQPPPPQQQYPQQQQQQQQQQQPSRNSQPQNYQPQQQQPQQPQPSQSNIPQPSFDERRNEYIYQNSQLSQQQFTTPTPPNPFPPYPAPPPQHQAQQPQYSAETVNNNEAPPMYQEITKGAPPPSEYQAPPPPHPSTIDEKPSQTTADISHDWVNVEPSSAPDPNQGYPAPTPKPSAPPPPPAYS